ncbi:MAG: UDP-N-acetylmuramate:L-alanyl-gamma-D-glutamyl-meso-diaminopimelate ligase [Proteobacteria bacterium]|nr:UDP-N-acetylmuramate:L-alanyl-gamma-D-glutamyl-meso-diaminopimelate ligase [Pseudomonadota bacterium]
MAAQHLHILGICGTFMGGVAALAKAAGFRVTGCDANVYPPMSDQLRALGIELIEGYSADQLSLQPDVWVVGNVVTRGNPLMEAILDRGDAYTSGPQWLCEHILCSKWVLAVAGTHGKTTTSAMLAWILEKAGLNPGFLIGGVPRNFPVSARLTASTHFVIEADEYDTAFFDKRSKFVHYRPKTAILNNLEFDHADIFGDIADIERQFHHLVRIVPGNGRLVVNGMEAALGRVIQKGAWTPVEFFGTPEGWESGPADADGSFEVSNRGRSMGRVRWALQGEHNRHNALAAIAASVHAGVDAGAAVAGLAGFESVKRRMELRGTVRGVAVYDDFAHHPTAIRTTLEGLRRKAGPARILAVLEPRSNTMKLGVMKAALPASVAAADKVFVYGANLGWDPAEVFASLGSKAVCSTDLGALVEAIAREARAGDQVLVMSNGGFGGIHEKLLARLAA